MAIDNSDLFVVYDVSAKLNKSITLGALSSELQGKITYWTRTGTNLYPSNLGDKIGIGTNAPNRTLHVNSTAFNPVRIESSQPDSRIEFKSLNSASHDTVSIGSAGNDFQINTNTAGGGVRRVTVKADGNVGIGTDNPQSNLHVQGDDATIRINDGRSTNPLTISQLNTAAEIINSGNGGLTFGLANSGSIKFVNQTNKTTRMIIADNGNVGIGKDNPAVKLDINGKARSNSTVAADAGTTLVTKDYLTSEIDALEDVYVNIDGDTMTGDLLMDGAGIKVGGTLPGTPNAQINTGGAVLGKVGVFENDGDPLTNGNTYGNFHSGSGNWEVAKARQTATNAAFLKLSKVSDVNGVDTLRERFMVTNVGNIYAGQEDDLLNEFKFKVESATGNIDTDGVLTVKNNSNFTNTLSVGDADYTSTGGTGVNLTAGGQVRGKNSSAIGNGGSVMGSFRDANAIAEIGVSKNGNITQAAGFIRLPTTASNDRYLYFSTDANLRTSNTRNNIGTTSGTVIGSQSSDLRLKQNVTDCTHGLAEVLQLEPIFFEYTSSPGVVQAGFSAQQVQGIIPEAVYDTNELLIPDELIDPEDESLGYKVNPSAGEPTVLAMEYVKLIPALVNSIKELKAENELLEARVAALEAGA